MCRYFIHSVLTAANGGSIAENLPYTDEDLAGLLDFNWLAFFMVHNILYTIMIDPRETKSFTVQARKRKQVQVFLMMINR